MSASVRAVFGSPAAPRRNTSIWPEIMSRALVVSLMYSTIEVIVW